ncbi:MAG: signal peptidase II [Acidimicrobiales bacterium]|nr:signal peptidase II [Acidimicrobiales bacterium]
MSRGRRLTYAALIVLGAVGLDQVTKEWALNRLSGNRTVDVLPSLEFDLAYNSGFSFSTGSGSGNIVGLVVIALCAFLAWQIVRETRTRRMTLYAIILGGAIGNLLDRIFRADDGFLSGKVIDFIDVSWYAVFNIADIFVVCGCIAFVIDELVEHRQTDAPPS